MSIDEREFFNEVTLRICSSLDIEKSMSRCVQYISQYLPLDIIFLNLYEKEQGAMRTIASATATEGKRLNRITYLPEEARNSLENNRQAFDTNLMEYEDAEIVNDPEQDPICRPMVEDFKSENSSLIVMVLVLENELIGHLIFGAWGKGIYKRKHAQLAALLKRPFAIAMSNALKHREVVKLKELITDDNYYLKEELRRLSGEEIVGADFGLKDVVEMANHVAPLDSPVLILGETGTGKEVIASAIHRASARRNHAFIRVNSGAIPESLLDSELFGHEKGAFTGAISQKRGRFERAHGGTIFLDEIGELPLNAQVRLLRVLQEKEIERVGGTESIRVDIRVIAATHRNLEEMIAEGTFREDLYFRLKVFPILIPPLRERRGDIPALINYFIDKKRREMKLRYTPKLAPGTLENLMNYNWPGNVRELENVVERALILSQKDPLTFTDLNSSPRLTLENRPEETSKPLKLNELMEQHIRSVLEMTGGRVEGKDGAAEMLGMNPGTLRHRMRLLKIPFGKTAKKQ